jgi:hypothetical protein
MANGNKQENVPGNHIVLTAEQAALLELYIQNLDDIFEHAKASEKLQVEIETLHLKKILTA